MSLTVAELATRLGGQVRGEGPAAGTKELEGLAPLEQAGPRELSFLTRPDYKARARSSRAGCILVEDESLLPGRPVIVVPDAHLAFASAMRLFHAPQGPTPGVHPRASVEPTAQLAPSVHVGAGAVVGAGARLGEGVVVHANAVVAPGCEVGAGSVLHPGVVLYEGTVIGEDVILHAGAVLGSDGFGYATSGGAHVKIPHVGRVVVEDGVEVGALTCIDRAVLGETRIGAGTKIDNLVQVAHNVRVGARSLLVAQSGISGSTVLGEGCVLAGQSGVAGHLELGDGARVGAKSAVFESVGPGRTVTGIPALAHERWRRVAAALSRLPDLVRRVRRLERRAEAGSEPARAGQAERPQAAPHRSEGDHTA